MTVNAKIISAVTPYVSACVFGGYAGANTTYCYFIFPQDNVEVAGDDDAVLDLVPVQLHLFTPNNYTTLKRQIRTALKNAGFTYPNVTCLYESDTKLNHIIFECEIVVASEKAEV